MKHNCILLALVVVTMLGAGLAIQAGNSGSNQLMYPTGSGSSIAFGDWVSTNASGALNTYYSFFVEVPPGQSRLVVDIFDADVLAGGTGEAAAGRDRQRAGGTTTGYSVRRPDGTVVPTSFNLGSATAPPGSDNAWVTLLDFTGDFVRDEFNAVSYANNDGTVNWSGDWTEVDPGGAGSAAGRIQVNDQVTTNALRITSDGSTTRSATRTANVSALGASATLSFDYYHRNLETSDLVQLLISTDGFSTTCSTTNFTNLSGNAGPIAFSLALPASCISTTTSIRFETSNLNNGGAPANRDRFFVDNVQIIGSSTTIPNGHWEVRVDLSSAVTTSTDLNAFAIRAHDGNPGAGGTEYNVYAENMISVGANPNLTTDYTLYPWVTSGCQCAINDFDTDSNETTNASMSLTDRTGTFSQTFGNASLSADNVWNRDLTSIFTSPDTVTGYGIWTYGITMPFYATSGNYATVYVSSATAPANPPGSNPAPGGFRLYFPTDAGSPPVKPYLEQLLTFVNNGAASNPPTAGQTATYQVTVRLVNPTPHPVVFSSPSNLVTANIPGSGVTYAGLAAVSQGAIASQPSVGGTGNVTWNPGTAAAGSTVLLTYRVQVVATGSPMNLTGTPITNGTRAQYLDETANATQARATNLVGPICQLSIGALATDAVIASLEASKDKSRVTVLWTTSSELGAAGFDLLRQDRSGWVRVTPDTIPALYANAAGGTYAVDDPGATGGRQTWAVQETTTDGRTILHGPFTVVPRPPQAADPKTAGPFGSKPNEMLPPKAKPPVPARRTGSVLIAETSTRGIHSIAASDVSSTLGMPIGAVRAGIRTGGFRLTNGNTEVAWTSDPSNDAIIFFAEAIDSPYTTRNAYQLTSARGLTMAESSAAPGAGGTTSYAETRWFESDVFAATAVPLDAEGDYWFWESFVPGFAGFTTKTLPLGVDALASSSGATLDVRLQGATTAPHGVKIRLNGVEVGAATWSGITPATVTAPLPPALLREGTNDVTIEGVRNPSGPLSVFYLDSMGLTWQRHATPRDGRLELVADGPITVTGLTSQALLLDTTDARRPVLLTGLTSDANGNLSWNASPGRRYVVATAAGVTPVATRASRAADLSGVRAADMLIVTSAAIRDAADAWAQYRRSKGLLVEVVEVEAIYDAVSGGIETPHAIRAWLGQAAGWSLAPRYVLLAGRGTWDYRGLAGDPPLVPPLMITTPDGIYASDARLADVDGDGAPDFAIGRLPVSDGDELRALLAKVERLEASQQGSPALFAADDPDRAVVFGEASDILQGSLPSGGSTLRINLQEQSLVSARSQLQAAWTSGLSLVNWTGHGGLDRLASEGLLVSSDVPGLATSSPPVVVALTCVINRFEMPNFATLGERLILHASGGAAAVWAPTGLAKHHSSAILGDAFYRALANSEGTATIGDLIRIAASKHPGAPSELYVLLGDPLTPVRLHKTSTTSTIGE